MLPGKILLSYANTSRPKSRGGLRNKGGEEKNRIFLHSNGRA